MHTPVEPKVGEILHLAARISHAGVIHATLGPVFILEWLAFWALHFGRRPA
jgi:hypothetical protein